MPSFLRERVPRYMQYITVLSASLASFSGLMQEASWVTSAPSLGFTLGSLITPIMLHAIGPKRSLLLAALPLAINWFGIAFSKSTVLLILMRFMAGLANGGIITILPLYIGEVSDKDIRGKLITFHSILSCTGSLFVLSIGPFVEYQTLALTCGIFPLIFIAIFHFMPDSPYFLILLDLKLIYAFSGWTTVKSFLQTIIGAAGSSISPQNSSLILGILQLPFVTVAAFLVDKLGRKALLVVSTFGCALTMAIEGLYFYLQDVVKADLQIVSWLPTICLALYLFFLPMGILTVSSIIPGEIFADNVKSLSAAISTSFSGSWTFLISRYFLQISDMWGMYAMFWIFSAVCFYGVLFGLFILPETKGKSFIEIQNLLKNKKYC